jgi:hypothetical protein
MALTKKPIRMQAWKMEIYADENYSQNTTDYQKILSRIHQKYALRYLTVDL